MQCRPRQWGALPRTLACAHAPAGWCMEPGFLCIRCPFMPDVHKAGSWRVKRYCGARVLFKSLAVMVIYDRGVILCVRARGGSEVPSVREWECCQEARPTRPRKDID